MILSVPKLISDMLGMKHNWLQVISCKILQFLTTLPIITQKSPGIYFLIFSVKKEPILKVFVGENKSIREMPQTTHVTEKT